MLIVLTEVAADKSLSLNDNILNKLVLSLGSHRLT